MCRGVTCPTGETCREGACELRPIGGGGNSDGSADSDTGVDGSHDAEASSDAAAERSEASSDSASSSDAMSDVTNASPDSSPDGNGGDSGCDGGACTPLKKAEGVSCASADQCLSGACVEGVCCNGVCTGGCNSCLQTYTGLADGKCGPVKAGLTHPGACTADSANSCGRDGTCDGAGACRRWKSGTACEAASCATDGFTSVAASTCNGAGICGAGAQISCGSYRCNAVTATCRMSCSSSSECSTTTYCAVGACKARLASGEACTGPDQCTSGFCDMYFVGYCKKRIDLECDVPHYGCIADLVDNGPCIFSYSCR